MPKNQSAIIAHEHIATKIFYLRGMKVMLSQDLAELYGVPTKALLQAVKRNADRFPSDFFFPLRPEEVINLRSQIVTSSWGGQRYLPYAFTQEGIAMLSSVLKSKRAVAMNIAIMRAFVKLREILSTNKELAAKLDALERKVGQHDQEIQAILEAIRQLMLPPLEQKKPFLGFGPDKN